MLRDTVLSVKRYVAVEAVCRVPRCTLRTNGQYVVLVHFDDVSVDVYFDVLGVRGGRDTASKFVGVENTEWNEFRISG